MYLDTQSSKRVGILATNTTGYVEAILRCIEAGDIAVPLRCTDDQYRIQAANVTQVITTTDARPWMRRDFVPAKTEDVALISFTSGTEGNPKGVILSHNNLTDVITRLNGLMQLDDGIREYVGVPVYHSFGFGRCRAILTAGGQFFIPSNGFNPAEVGEMLRKGEINAISAVPSLWRVLLTHKDLIGEAGRKVRWIEIGSQYMSRQEKEALKALFPEANIVQHYGLTEASRTALLPIHEIEGDLLESVGQIFGSVEVQQTPKGQIAIRGNHVALSYLIDGREVPLQDNDGWFLTKDLGSLDDGYLYYKGRADDVINCGGIKVSPEALEAKVYSRFGCSSGLAICRKTDLMRGEGFLVAITKEFDVDKQQLREVALQSIQELGVNAGNAITVIDVDNLPKTATGKIQRKQLAEWYALKSSYADHLVKIPDTLLADSSSIQAFFCRTLNVRQVQAQDTFISLGGDSLSYVQLSMDIERYLGYLPKKWEQIPLNELEKLVFHQKTNTIIEIDVLLRCLAISGVVFTQSGLPFIEGGAMLMLLIASLNFARFQGCALIQGRWQSILPLLRNILIPYLVLAIAYQVWKQKFNLAILLIVGNFQSPEVQNSHSIFFVWFVAHLVQCIVLFTLPFAIPSVRKFADISPWRYGLIPLGIGIGTHLLGPYIWDSSYLSNQVPHMLFWLFALGWCIHFAKSRPEKLVTTVMILLLPSTFIGLDGLYGWWVLIGGSMLLWLSYVPIPSILKLPIQTISAATYYIYLTVMIFRHLLTEIVGIDHPLVTIPVTLLGGVLIWSAIQGLQQFISYKRFGKLDHIGSL